MNMPWSFCGWSEFRGARFIELPLGFLEELWNVSR